jgi:hypothetical protein
VDPRGDVDAVAHQLAGAVLHVAQVDADAQLHAPGGGRRGVVPGKAPLDRQRALDRGQRAGELDEERISHRLDLVPAVARQDLPHPGAMLLQQLDRQGLVPVRQRAVADEVGEHDRREAARGRRRCSVAGRIPALHAGGTHLGVEPVAEAVHGLDRPGVLAQRLAQLGDRAGQGRIADHAPGPHRAHEVVLAHGFARAAQQVAQEFEGLELDADGAAGDEEPHRALVEHHGAERPPPCGRCVGCLELVHAAASLAKRAAPARA